MNYYCARLHIIALVDGAAKTENICDESIIVIQAHDFEYAFQRAIEIGKEREIVYQNGDGQNVRWTLFEVAEIRYIGATIDGAEVMSKMFETTVKEALYFEIDFQAEAKEPDYR